MQSAKGDEVGARPLGAKHLGDPHPLAGES